MFLFKKMHTSHTCVNLQAQAPCLGIRGISGCACSCRWALSSLPPSQGTLSLSWFLRGGEGAPGLWRVETRDAAQQPQGPGHRPPRERSQVGALPQRARAEVLSGLGPWAGSVLRRRV